MSFGVLIYFEPKMWKFSLTLILTQGFLFGYLRRSAWSDRILDVAKAQSLLWSFLMIGQVIASRFSRIFDGFCLQLPVATQIYIFFHAFFAYNSLVLVPILTLIIASPHLWIKSETRRRQILKAQYATAWAYWLFTIWAITVTIRLFDFYERL